LIPAYLLLPLVMAISCHSSPGFHKNDKENGSDIPEYRRRVKTEPIAALKERTDNKLNDWYFSVQLFETPKTFYYQLKMQFEEVKGEDILKLPDFGMTPRPALLKGKDRFSCIIGFYDNENKFREYKLVSVVDGRELKLTTLNHFAVVEQ
jgi:hypothetical protein